MTIESAIIPDRFCDRRRLDQPSGGGLAAIALWGIVLVPRGWALAARLVPLKASDALAVIAVPLAMSGAVALLHLGFRPLLPEPLIAECALAIVLALIGLAATVGLQRKPLRHAISVFRS